MAAFFGAGLEPTLKAAFSRRSSACIENGPMNGDRTPLRHAIGTVSARRMALAVITVLTGVVAGAAAVPSWAGGKVDHDRARAAVQSGDVLPLPTVLERLQRTHPGQVLELELERDDDADRWIYEIRMLQADGQLLKLELDARTAQVLKARRHDGGKDARR